MSSPSEPEEMVSMSIERSLLPSFITAPLPNWRSIWESAADRALVLSMEDPSTIRRAVGAAAIGGAPYDGDSLAGQTGGNGISHFRERLMGTTYPICSRFAICSFQMVASLIISTGVGLFGSSYGAFRTAFRRVNPR